MLIIFILRCLCSFLYNSVQLNYSARHTTIALDVLPHICPSTIHFDPIMSSNHVSFIKSTSLITDKYKNDLVYLNFLIACLLILNRGDTPIIQLFFSFQQYDTHNKTNCRRSTALNYSTEKLDCLFVSLFTKAFSN